MNVQPLMYTEIADWWPILSHPSEYVEEADIFTRTILNALPSARSVLELGSGGGNNASHMKRRFSMTLVDRSPAMLAVSQRLNPDLPHQQGDMRTARLGRTFDVLFIHDAINYLTHEDDLRQCFETVALHTRPGGITLLVPDHVKETFRAGTDHGGLDGEAVDPPMPGRSLRYLEWTYDPDPTDTTYLVDYAYLLREGPSVRCLYDRHELGLFPRATWLRLLEQAGFHAQALPFEHSEVEPGTTEMILGIKPDE